MAAASHSRNQSQYTNGILQPKQSFDTFPTPGQNEDKSTLARQYSPLLPVAFPNAQNYISESDLVAERKTRFDSELPWTKESPKKELFLRRKILSGTLSNGYDGSIVDLYVQARENKRRLVHPVTGHSRVNSSDYGGELSRRRRSATTLQSSATTVLSYHALLPETVLGPRNVSDKASGSQHAGLSQQPQGPVTRFGGEARTSHEIQLRQGLQPPRVINRPILHFTTGNANNLKQSSLCIDSLPQRHATMQSLSLPCQMNADIVESRRAHSSTSLSNSEHPNGAHHEVKDSKLRRNTQGEVRGHQLCGGSMNYPSPDGVLLPKIGDLDPKTGSVKPTFDVYRRVGDFHNFHRLPFQASNVRNGKAQIYQNSSTIPQPLYECPILLPEDASRPDRVLSWARAVYEVLVSLNQGARKQRFSTTGQLYPKDLKINVRSPFRDSQLRDPFINDIRKHPAAYDSLAYHSIQGLHQPAQQHHLSINDGHSHGFGNAGHPVSHGNSSSWTAAYHAGPHYFSPNNQPLNGPGVNPMPPCSSRTPHNYHNSFASEITPQHHGVDLLHTARQALNLLATFCSDPSRPWLEGMLHMGCLAYALGDYHESIHWLSNILNIDSNDVEAMSKLAVVFLATNQPRKAENQWRMAIKLRPSYLEAAEHLVELLCSEQRRKDALEVVDHVQTYLQSAPNSHSEMKQMFDHGSAMNDSPSSLGSSHGTASRIVTEYDDEQEDPASSICPTSRPPTQSPQQRRTVLSAGVDGRLLALIHCKGNILYSMDDHVAAAQAFEQVVLLTLRVYRTLPDLIKFLLDMSSKSVDTEHYSENEALLLTPKRALDTVNLCFPNGEYLAGIQISSNWVSHQTVISILSNSLLSLAKVFQDGLACSMSVPSASIPKYEARHILALYYLSFSLKPSPSTANNIGILLACVQRSMPDKCRNLPVKEPVENAELHVPGVIPGSGTWLALKYYEYGLSLDSKHAHLYTNLGSLLKDIGQLPMAIEMYQRAVACDENFDIALANLANAVKDQGKTREAIIYYKRAVDVNPKFSEAICGLANVLNSICDWTSRGGVVVEDGAFDRWHVDDKGDLVDSHNSETKGSGWIRHVVEVVDSQLIDGEAWGRGVVFDRQSLEVFVNQLLVHQLGGETYAKQAKILRETLSYWSGQNHEGLRTVRLVERAIRLISWKWYHDKNTRGKEEPPSAYARPQLPTALPTLGAPKVLPFHTFTLPLTARQIRSISQRNALRTTCATLRSPWLPGSVYPPPLPPSPHLNVGYVSSDFNNHPLAHLMQSVFGLHDKKRVRAICYATTASDHSSYRQKIENEAPLFHDASGWSAEQLVRQIICDNVHILINLNGYTRGARNEIFAARPAPIQMSFMGYAGTLGAEWCDYILADDTAIPEQTLRPWRCNVDLQDLVQDENTGADNHDWVYGENIIYTRESFFCCDHRQSASQPEDAQMSWEDEQKRRWKMRKEIFPTLKDNAIIFGNFNQLYKIDPTVFRTWLRILSQVPDAILWLLRFPDLGEPQLRATAYAWAGPSVAARIVFTDVAPKAIHIVRACVIDLFLDTPECNGHTTAADCLWSGTPLLTLPRYPWKMASRMAAGILGGALDRSTPEGREAWKELVADSEEEYENTAVRLARGLKYHGGSDGLAEGRLMELRKLVWQGKRRRGGLFDTERWVGEVEDGYEEAWRRWVKGEGGDIRLADL